MRVKSSLDTLSKITTMLTENNQSSSLPLKILVRDKSTRKNYLHRKLEEESMNTAKM